MIGEITRAWERGRRDARDGLEARAVAGTLLLRSYYRGGYRHERERLRAERRLPQLELPLQNAMAADADFS